MGLPTEPLKAIFPIFAVKQGSTYSFLGTGFFLKKDGTFLTAKHVFADNPLGVGEYYEIVFMYEGRSVHNVSNVRFSESFDIALGQADIEKIVDNIEHLELAEKDAPLNDDILTIEFSGTRTVTTEAGREIRLPPSNRKGYVIRYYTSDYPEVVPTKVLDLSFPALKGASGAPVIDEKDGRVIGLIVANVERHLLPAQIERIDNGIKPKEEVRYFLPTGKAISWKHLTEFVQLKSPSG
ncbi:MAG: trypsin-like peptidase domain-containing protein [Dehalococcoidia bacterium]|nr:trypsin-like peptidase domain-containing protein [Dehalococcoidia bacterium]